MNILTQLSFYMDLSFHDLDGYRINSLTWTKVDDDLCDGSSHAYKVSFYIIDTGTPARAASYKCTLEQKFKEQGGALDDGLKWCSAGIQNVPTIMFVVVALLVSKLLM